MATVQDFTNIKNIDGVKSYYLVKYDGKGLAFHGDNADDLFPFIAFAGLNCDTIRSSLGLSEFKHMVFSRQSQEDLLLFGFSNYFLAVIKEAKASADDLVLKIDDFIETIKKSSTAGQLH